MYQIGVREFRAFKPKPFDGKLSVFRTKGPRFDACDPLPIWRLAAKSVELFEVEGAHATIMDKPYVETLAAQLARCLASELPSRPLAGINRAQAGDTVATLAAELLDNGRNAIWQGGN
jgi:hypothetical protein